MTVWVGVKREERKCAFSFQELCFKSIFKKQNENNNHFYQQVHLDKASNVNALPRRHLECQI